MIEKLKSTLRGFGSAVQQNERSSLWVPVRGTPAWDQTWAILAGRWGDVEARDPLSGETWQHMGTWLLCDGSGWEVSFRHRCHRDTGMREYFSAPATDALLEHLPENLKRAQREFREREQVFGTPRIPGDFEMEYPVYAPAPVEIEPRIAFNDFDVSFEGSPYGEQNPLTG